MPKRFYDDPSILALSKVTDPKSGAYPGSAAHEQWKREQRQHLRDNPTPAERILLGALTEDEGWTFQPIILGFIPDFGHEKGRMIVEVDGSVHNTTSGRRRDARRDHAFRNKGWIVRRFSNQQVMNQLPDVLHVIHAILHARL